MGLDISFKRVEYIDTHNLNITHNLNKMAETVVFPDGHNLYQVLWRPEEVFNDKIIGKVMLRYLYSAQLILWSDPEKFKKFNPENGWGSYDTLNRFLTDYIKFCQQYPDYEIEVSR